MRRANVATLLLVLLSLTTALAADDVGIPYDLLVELVERSEFDDLAAELASGATPLGADRAQMARALFAPSARLRASEREALLLLLLRGGDGDDERAPLADALFARLDRLEDWTLLALLFEAGTRADSGTLFHGLDVAERILAALEEPSPRRAGYERAAIAVAGHARAAVEADHRTGGAPGTDGAATKSAAFALAETLRSIARLSRSEAVVDAARTSARILLDLPAPERDG